MNDFRVIGTIQNDFKVLKFDDGKIGLFDKDSDFCLVTDSWTREDFLSWMSDLYDDFRMFCRK